MKIVFSSAASLPTRSAESIFVMKMCEALKKGGHEVILIAPQKPDDIENVSNIFDFYSISIKFQMKLLPWLRIPGKRYIFGFSTLKFARNNKIDFIYTRSIHTAFVCACCSFPMVFESHIPVSDSGPLNEILFRLVLKSSRLKKIVVISNALKNHYRQKYGIDRKSIIVAHDAADKVEEVEPFDWSNKGRFKVGYVGHLYPGRGLEIILELAKRCDWADFHCVGGLEKDIELWKHRSNKMKNIFFHGFVPFSKTERYRQSVDVLIAPYQRKVSIYDGGDSAKWMSPLKIFEYMASKKPIIASDLPVLHEIINDNDTALLCDPDNIESWCNALNALRTRNELRKRLATKAREIFENYYSWDARIEKILSSLG